jgi:predicted secreted protein
MRAFKWLYLAASLALTLTLAGTALAAEPTPRYNTIELQADAQREVANDTLSASLYVELNDANPAALANAINKAANEALRLAKEYKSVRVRLGNNQTYPVYAKGNVLQGWRGRAETRIESRDFEAASGLIGKLQAGMQLGSLSFSVSPEARRQAENELIAEAIGAFKARAEIVRGALAGRGYKIARLNVNSGSSTPPPRFPMARALAAGAPEVAAPNLEGGVSLVTVTVGGAIEVLD